MSLSAVMAGKTLADKGRGGDTLIAHLTQGDTVIPMQVMQALPAHIQDAIAQTFKKGGADPGTFVAGSPTQKINPATGQPEFGWFSSFFHNPISTIAHSVTGNLPTIAGAALAGLTGGLSIPVGAALGGAVGGLASGGGISGALSGGLKGYGLGTGFDALSAGAGALAGGSSLGGAATAAGNAVSPTLTNILSGGGSGTLSGGLSAAGDAISGAGTSLSSLLGGGASNITAPAAGAGSFGTGTGGLLTNGAAGAASPSSGLLSGLFGSGGIGAGGGGSSFSGLIMPAASLASGIMNAGAINKSTDQLKAAQATNIANNAPFLAAGTAANNTLADKLGTSGNATAPGYGSLSKAFTPGDLQSTPGYQFQMDQGTQALQRQQAASGSLDSGAAMKAAQQFGTGLADSTYQQAYANDQSNKQQQYNMLAGQTSTGLAAANNGIAPNTMLGNAGAAGTIAGQNNITNTLSGILGKTIVGYNSNGTPIYA